jgi:hypothetical protein
MDYVFYFKLSCIAAGLIIIFLGYRLFLKGIFNESGDLEGSWKSSKLIVKKAAPGTYFVLFGSLVICSAIFKGMSNSESYGGSGHNQFQPSLSDTARMPPVIDTTKIQLQ